MAKTDSGRDSQFDTNWLRNIVQRKGFPLALDEINWFIAGLHIMAALLHEHGMNFEMFLHRVKLWEGSVIPKPVDGLIREIANRIKESDKHPRFAAGCLEEVALEIATDSAAFFAQHPPNKEPVQA